MTTASPADFAALGITVPSEARGDVRTTCPQCSHSRRKQRDRCLAVDMEKGLWYCHHCQWTGHLTLRSVPAKRSRRLAKSQSPQHIDITSTSREISSISGISRGGAVFAGMRRWEEARPLNTDDPVWRYLCTRGLTPSGALPALRYHPRLPYRHDDGTWTYHPAMLAAVSTLQGERVSLHRTYVDGHGVKAHVPSPKKVMQPATPGGLRGAAIHLFAPETTLALTEGIETALAVHRLSGWPVWSCISATGLAHVAIPATITTLYICADHDPTGLQAAYTLARQEAQARTVTVLVPPCPGDDWNDVLQREGV
jgi:Toprim domain